MSLGSDHPQEMELARIFPGGSSPLLGFGAAQMVVAQSPLTLKWQTGQHSRDSGAEFQLESKASMSLPKPRQPSADFRQQERRSTLAPGAMECL